MTPRGTAWATRCPGSLLPHAGPAVTPPWLPAAIKRYRANGYSIDRVWDANAKYVVCAVCGKSTTAIKSGTPRSHPPSRIGPEKEARRRERARLKVNAELADVRSGPRRVADDLAALLGELGEG